MQFRIQLLGSIVIGTRYHELRYAGIAKYPGSLFGWHLDHCIMTVMDVGIKQRKVLRLRLSGESNKKYER
jgi:hypothetical protein